ncbi:MAG: undecaprenyl-diphosphate phosphatase [Coleofasciculaceae cyanobacterium SM2_1_6]|nr:undecaprenyl-diphosphate phosphatase [Coleofasciculaceae cyanobacterium SM2_1_6]
MVKKKYWLTIATSLAVVVAMGQGATAQDGSVINGVAQMNAWQALALGAVQGLTEFLPISSTAHLKVVPVALGWGDPGVAFTAVIQLGSIAAVLWYFWTDIRDITLGAIEALQKSYLGKTSPPKVNSQDSNPENDLTPSSTPDLTPDSTPNLAPDLPNSFIAKWQQAFGESQELRLATGIALGTIPIVFFGLLIKALIPDFDNSPLRSLQAIALASIVMSLLLGLAEKLGKRVISYEKLGTKEGIFMGLAQALALLPGVSRSGSTLTAGLFLGIERAAAARFSFLLGIPAITLAGLVELRGVLSETVPQEQILSLVVGTISSAIFSYGAIAWLLDYLKKQSTWIFIWYRLGFGVLILLFMK